MASRTSIEVKVGMRTPNSCTDPKPHLHSAKATPGKMMLTNPKKAPKIVEIGRISKRQCVHKVETGPGKAWMIVRPNRKSQEGSLFSFDNPQLGIQAVEIVQRTLFFICQSNDLVESTDL